MGCSVQATFPSPCPAKGALDDPNDPHMLACFRARAILAQMKVTLSRKIRSLVIRPTAEGCINVSHTPVEGVAGTFPHPTSDGGYETALEELSDVFPLLPQRVSSPPAVEVRTSTMTLEMLMNLSVKHFCKQEPTTAECITSDSRRQSADGSSCARSSTGGSSADLLNLCSTGGPSNDSWKHSTSDSASEPSGTPDPQRHSTCAMPDSRRYSTGGTSSSQACSTFGSWRQQYSTCAASSHTWRYSTGRSDTGLSDYKKEVPTFCSSNKGHLISPINTMRSLLNPSTSMQTFLSLICTEETLVSTSDSKILQGASKSKRCSSEVLVRPRLKRVLNAESLDWSTVPTDPRAGSPPEDDYSNSNISWSSPLEDDHPHDIRKEEDDQATSERSTSATIPIEHFAIYVGGERRKFVISPQVVTHELFKQLLVSENYKMEGRDGKFTFVLLCDTDYFQRLLFFVDQRKPFDEHQISLFSSSEDVLRCLST